MKEINQNKKDRFINAMNKPWSVERSVILNVRPRRVWGEGLTVGKLLTIINGERQRKKKYTKDKIYDAVSQINRFGSQDWGIYIITRIGWIDNEKNNLEHRYFNVKNIEEADGEKRRLDHRKETIILKENNVIYHEEKTIPQEEKQVELLNKNEN